MEAAERALKAVLTERLRQNEKWGEQNHPDAIWLQILSEEVGEWAQACLHYQFGGLQAATRLAEAIQVAAVALQIVEAYYREDS